MKIFTFIIFALISLVTLPAYSLKIAIVDINYIIDNNKTYINIIEDIEINEKKYLDDFEKKENDLFILLKDIDESKLLLNQDQLNSKIDNYNIQLNKFSELIESYNSHYENEIIKIRENILSNIIKILEQYAEKNKLDLILDSTSYLIASNSLDITEIISKVLEKINLKLEFKNFEKD